MGDEPSAPEVDYKGMWQTYSGWTRDQSARFKREESGLRAGMARRGIKRGTQAWELELENLSKQQQKERRTLTRGSTASQLQERMERSMRFRGVSGKTNLSGYDPAQERAKTAQAGYDKAVKSIDKSMRTDEGGHKMMGYDKAMGEVQSVEDRIKEMEAQDAADYKASKWFDSREVESMFHSDAGPRTRTEHFMTRAGKQRMGELTTQDHAIFGRPLKTWEAYAEMTMGSPQEAQLSTEERSAARAVQAAGGQRSGGQTRAAGAQELADEAAAISPWVKKQNYGVM